MITLIIGTNRLGCCTKAIALHVQAIYELLKEPLSVIDLAELPSEIFLPTAYVQKPQGFDQIIDKVLKADGLVVVTPEYNGSMPGVLKYFIDMLPFPESFELRPVCFIGLSAGSWGALRPVEHLQQIFGFRNAYIYPKRVFLPHISKLLDETGGVKDAEIQERLRKQAQGFIQFTRQLKQEKSSSDEEGSCLKN